MSLTEYLLKLSNEEKLNKLNTKLMEKIQTVAKIELEKISIRYTYMIESLKMEIEEQMKQVLGKTKN